MKSGKSCSNGLKCPSCHLALPKRDPSSSRHSHGMGVNGMNNDNNNIPLSFPHGHKKKQLCTCGGGDMPNHGHSGGNGIPVNFDVRHKVKVRLEESDKEKCKKQHEINYGDSQSTLLSSSSQGTKCFGHCCYKCRNNNNNNSRNNNSPGQSNQSVGVKTSESVKMFFGHTFIFLLAVAIYSNSLSGEFVHDDVVAIVRNPDVNLAKAIKPPVSTSSSSSPDFYGESASNEGGSWWSLWKNDYWGMSMSSPLSHKSYRPLTVLTFRLNYWLCGETLCPTMFHGTNVLIHALVSCLTLYLCRHVLQMTFSSSLTIACLFAVHPIHSEAVAGITGRADALACLMMLASFILYHSSLRQFNRDWPCRQQDCLYRRETVTANRKIPDDSENFGRDRDSDQDGFRCKTGNQFESHPTGTTNPTTNSQCNPGREKSCFVPASAAAFFECQELVEYPGTHFSPDLASYSPTSPPTDPSSSSFISWKALCLLLISGLVGCSAMLAKETGITVLGINILYDLYVHLHHQQSTNHSYNCSRRKATTLQDKQAHNQDERTFSSSYDSSKYADMKMCEKNKSSLANFKLRVTFIFTLILLSLTFRIVLMNGTFPRFGRPDNPAAYATSDLTKLLTFAFLPVFNLGLILHPQTLCYDWQMGSIPLVESVWDLRNFASVAFYITFFLLTWRSQKRPFCQSSRVALFVSLLFLVLPFLPASNLLFPVGFVVAERILYTSSLGVCILLVLGLERLLNMAPHSTQKLSKVTTGRNFGKCFVSYAYYFCVVAATILLIISLGFRTWQRNSVWQSRLSLFTSGIKDVPHNAKTHYNYANLQKDERNTVGAIEHYTVAIRLWPEYASAHNNLGTLLMSNPAAAEHQFLKAIKVGQAHGGAHFNLGVLYMNNEKYLEAVTHFKKSLIIDPSHQEAFEYLSVCINLLHNQTFSISHNNNPPHNPGSQPSSLSLHRDKEPVLRKENKFFGVNKEMTSYPINDTTSHSSSVPQPTSSLSSSSLTTPGLSPASFLSAPNNQSAVVTWDISIKLSKPLEQQQLTGDYRAISSSFQNTSSFLLEKLAFNVDRHTHSWQNIYGMTTKA